MLDLEIGKEIYYERTKSKYHPLNTNLVDIKSGLGLKRIREYLGITDDDFELLDNYNIIVEGDSDKKYITEIGMCFGLNIPNIIHSGGASKIDKYLEFYNNFYKERDFKPEIRVIFDNDDAGRKEYNRFHGKLHLLKNIKVTAEFIPNCFGELPLLEDIKTSKVKSNYEIEDFIYPELIHYLALELMKKIILTTFKFNKLEQKVKAAAFKEKGILYNVDLLKNENNPDDGVKIDFSSEQAKNGMVGLFNIKGTKKLSELIIEADRKYPEVKKYIEKICKPN